MNVKKVDLVKEDKSYYKASKKIDLIKLEKIPYLTLAGQGEPAGQEFAAWISAQYSVHSSRIASSVLPGVYPGDTKGAALVTVIST